MEQERPRRHEVRQPGWHGFKWLTVIRLFLCGLGVDFGIAHCLSVVPTGMNELVQDTKPPPAGPAMSRTGLRTTEPGGSAGSCWENHQFRLTAIKLIQFQIFCSVPFRMPVIFKLVPLSPDGIKMTNKTKSSGSRKILHPQMSKLPRNKLVNTLKRPAEQRGNCTVG